MRKVSETMAGKWFLGNGENKYKLYTGIIPKKVILSLSKFNNEELSSLSHEICWDSYWNRFQELELEKQNVSSLDFLEVEEDAFEEYLDKYQKEFFASFSCQEEMIDEVSNKLKSLLDAIIFWYEGFIVIKEDFDLFETAEQKVMIDLSPMSSKREKINNTKKKVKKIEDIFSEFKKEESSFDLIIEAIKGEDIQRAQTLYSIIKKIQERLE